MRICMLTELKPEEWGRIVAREGGRGIRQKLLLRGLSEGTTVRMISCYQGPVVVEANRSVVALGRGAAQKIRVMGGN